MMMNTANTDDDNDDDDDQFNDEHDENENENDNENDNDNDNNEILSIGNIENIKDEDDYYIKKMNCYYDRNNNDNNNNNNNDNNDNNERYKFNFWLKNIKCGNMNIISLIGLGIAGIASGK
jgi:hypothetical protein